MCSESEKEGEEGGGGTLEEEGEYNRWVAVDRAPGLAEWRSGTAVVVAREEAHSRGDSQEEGRSTRRRR